MQKNKNKKQRNKDKKEKPWNLLYKVMALVSYLSVKFVYE